MSDPEARFSVTIPKLGLTMAEATILEWHKREGEAIRQGEVLFTLENEKSTLEIEAPASGVLHIGVPAGQTVPVLGEIGWLMTRPETPGGPPHASPVADIQQAQASPDLAAVPGAGLRGSAIQGRIEGAPDAPVDPRRLPLSGLRGIIAERLSAGWRERPQVTLTTQADATNLVSARQQMLAETGEKIAYDAFLVKCVAGALAEHPALNARLGPTGIELLAEINVGVAVDTERGLLVPVIRDAHRLNLRAVQAHLQALVDRAHAGCSLPDDLTGGTFTITNLGMYEVDTSTPIINPPECAILGVGRIVARPVGVDGQVVLRDMLGLSLSFDHRLVDGAPAARFLQRVKQRIERPFPFLVE